jgi:hypothetical protein
LFTTIPRHSLERQLVEKEVSPAIAAEIAGHNPIPGLAPAALHLPLRQIAVAETAIELTPTGGGQAARRESGFAERGKDRLILQKSDGLVEMVETLSSRMVMHLADVRSRNSGRLAKIDYKRGLLNPDNVAC